MKSSNHDFDILHSITWYVRIGWLIAINIFFHNLKGRICCMRVVYLNLECILQITRCTFFTIFTYPYTCNKVWCIKKRTKHTMSLWLYCSFFGLYVWAPNISHFKGLDMRNLQYAIRIYQKSHYKVTMQWQFIFGSIFNASDVTISV